MSDANSTASGDLPVVQRLASIFWPSFLTASGFTIIFFTLFDPVQLSLISGGPPISRLGGYTIGFFCFWGLTALSCALTCYFRRPCKPHGYRPQRGSGDT